MLIFISYFSHLITKRRSQDLPMQTRWVDHQTCCKDYKYCCMKPKTILKFIMCIIKPLIFDHYHTFIIFNQAANISLIFETDIRSIISREFKQAYSGGLSSNNSGK